MPCRRLNRRRTDGGGKSEQLGLDGEIDPQPLQVFLIHEPRSMTSELNFEIRITCI